MNPKRLLRMANYRMPLAVAPDTSDEFGSYPDWGPEGKWEEFKNQLPLAKNVKRDPVLWTKDNVDWVPKQTRPYSNHHDFRPYIPQKLFGTEKYLLRPAKIVFSDLPPHEVVDQVGKEKIEEAGIIVASPHFFWGEFAAHGLGWLLRGGLPNHDHVDYGDASSNGELTYRLGVTNAKAITGGEMITLKSYAGLPYVSYPTTSFDYYVDQALDHDAAQIRKCVPRFVKWRFVFQHGILADTSPEARAAIKMGVTEMLKATKGFDVRYLPFEGVIWDTESDVSLDPSEITPKYGPQIREFFGLKD